MQYFFILGNNPTLSLTELSAVFGFDKIQGYLAAPEVFILETGQEINPAELIKKLGGTIKIGLITDKANPDNQAIISQACDLAGKQEKAGKFKFGLSYYGGKKLNLKPIGMEIKKYLKEKAVSCRWVVSKEKTLSSVVVEQNKLTSKGIEIVLIQDDNKILIGKTLVVQPFKELSFRDYGRPARDDESGMLPPKLAQIMINLSQAKTEDTIIDPSCGSGTILTEAMLMGYKNLIGSDISKKAIEDTEKNVKWIIENWKLKIGNLKLYQLDAQKISQEIKPDSINYIITEPYLGPQRGKIDIKKIAQELKQLYTKSLKEFSKILKPKGRIVMVWPVFRISRNAQRITPDIGGFKIINPIPKNLRENEIIKLTDRNTIIYGREQQKVWREIVILEK
ncbi:MAG: methyltransferase domain-containing protein [Patescibacteria group bacterium]|nr:methyltransferase domain-containing protein [Patescibacteria group bacterium]